MTMHEAHISDENHHNGPSLDGSEGLITRILGTRPAWATIGIDALVKALESGHIRPTREDLSGQPSALRAWLSSCPSRLVKDLRDAWFLSMGQVAGDGNLAPVSRLEQILEQAGCDPLARDASGVDCVDLACLHGRHEIIRRWHDQGLDLALDARRIFLPSASGQWYNPLHLAAFAGGIDQMQALLDAGANINATDQTGKTALFHAKDEASIRWLVENGADTSIIDHAGIDARVHWQSGLWPSQKIDQRMACLSSAPSALSGALAIPAFVALAYKQPATRLKSEMTRLGVGYDAVHDGHGLLGHAALRVIGHQGSSGSAATRWLGGLLERPQSLAAATDIDIGLLCLVYRVGPRLDQPTGGDPLASVIRDLACKSATDPADCLRLAMNRYPHDVPLHLMRQPHYLERFFADLAHADIITGCMDFLVDKCAQNPPLSLAWLVDQVQAHPSHPVWRTPRALDIPLTLAKKEAAAIPYGSTTDKVEHKIHQALILLAQQGARTADMGEFRQRLDAIAFELARHDRDRAPIIASTLASAYDAAALADNTPPAKPRGAAARL